MSLRIIGDSLFDLNDNLRKIINPIIVPLKISVGDRHFIDDEALDKRELMKIVKEYPEAAKTSSPSPYDFMKAFEKAGDSDIYCITVAAKHSATFMNAIYAKEMYLEKTKDKIIHVIDSFTASGGETLIGMKILELEKLNLKAEQICERINEYVSEMKTYFVLESIDNLVKSGRISSVVAKVVTTFSIRPIMETEDDGTLKMCEKVRGTKKALRRLVDIIGERGDRIEEKIMSIAHCNCAERAETLKAEILSRYRFKDIVILEMGGVSGLYANNGGIIISF